jgi:hypothetical protein
MVTRWRPGHRETDGPGSLGAKREWGGAYGGDRHSHSGTAAAVQRVTCWQRRIAPKQNELRRFPTQTGWLHGPQVVAAEVSAARLAGGRRGTGAVTPAAFAGQELVAVRVTGPDGSTAYARPSAHGQARAASATKSFHGFMR